MNLGTQGKKNRTNLGLFRVCARARCSREHDRSNKALCRIFAMSEVQAIDLIVRQVQAWCGLNGLMYTDGKLNWSHAPVSLLPNPFPRKAFEHCNNVQPMINELVDKMSRDRRFLLDTLASTGKADPFTQRLMDIYAKQPEQSITSGLQLGIFRSDYMLNTGLEAELTRRGGESANFPLQIEINTIAASFGCLSHKTANLHRHILNRNADRDEITALLREAKIDESLVQQGASEIAQTVPENASMQSLAASLAHAHKMVQSKLDNSAPVVILFIVQPNERNIADQRALEMELWTSHQVKVEFMTLVQVAAHGRLISDAETGWEDMLVVRPGRGAEEVAVSGGPRVSGEHAVSIVYYRAGYTPDDYPSETEWGARELMETSSAIKCPSVGYQLCGTKKIQQVLCLEGIMEKFISEQNAIYMRQFFAAQYAMGAKASDDGLRAMESAILDGSKWVLKPQREGGGNNMYGATLSNYLCTHRDDPVLSGYVLMQRIFPQNNTTLFLRKGEVLTMPSISELGIYGTFLGDGAATYRNDYAGYLLRTKQTGVDEGGVATGYSVLNSVMLHE